MPNQLWANSSLYLNKGFPNSQSYRSEKSKNNLLSRCDDMLINILIIIIISKGVRYRMPQNILNLKHNLSVCGLMWTRFLKFNWIGFLGFMDRKKSFVVNWLKNVTPFEIYWYFSFGFTPTGTQFEHILTYFPMNAVKIHSNQQNSWIQF